MFERVKNIILYGDCNKESFDTVKTRIEEYNQGISLAFASIATFLITVMLVLSYIQEGFSESKPVYIFGIIFSVFQILLSLLARKYRSLSYLCVYMAVSIFLLYGIAIGTLTRPEEQTVTFMVLLIFVPLIFVDIPLRMALSIIFYVVIFIIMACNTKAGSTLSVDITDAIIFGILAIISEMVVYRAKIRGYVLEYQLQVMSETDQLTGLKNRNCYELKLPMYKDGYSDSICCIYIDVNGLHELNNSKGHKAGDEMLIYIANEVRSRFEKSDVYRIGGDEYVVFALDIPEEEIIGKIAVLKKRIYAQNYHAAIGYQYFEGKGLDVNDLIMKAESKMYKNKAEYYNKHNRRSR